MVPDELIVDMLANVLDSKKPAKGVIFDGFPRTIPQAKALKKMLNERGTDVSVMLKPSSRGRGVDQAFIGAR